MYTYEQDRFEILLPKLKGIFQEQAKFIGSENEEMVIFNLNYDDIRENDDKINIFDDKEHEISSDYLYSSHNSLFKEIIHNNTVDIIDIESEEFPTTFYYGSIFLSSIASYLKDKGIDLNSLDIKSAEFEEAIKQYPKLQSDLYLYDFVIKDYRAIINGNLRSVLLCKHDSKVLVITTKDVHLASQISDAKNRILNAAVNTTDFPKNGVWEIRKRQNAEGGCVASYEAFEKENSLEIIHQVKDEVFSSIQFFTENIDLFSKHGQQPFRKILFTGEPGSGKSTLLSNIQEKYKDIYPILLINSIDGLKSSLEEVSEHSDKPCIIIWDECVRTSDGLRHNSRNSSEILNILDGYKTPNLKNGVLLLLTTNYPEEMDPRISKRPGRIDKIFQIGSINATYAKDLFLLYFEDLLKECNVNYNTKESIEAMKLIATGMTGAQVKELFNSYVSYMVGQNKKFDFYEVGLIKEELYKSFELTNENSVLNFDSEKLNEALKHLRNIS